LLGALDELRQALTKQEWDQVFGWFPAAYGNAPDDLF